MQAPVSKMIADCSESVAEAYIVISKRSVISVAASVQNSSGSGAECIDPNTHCTLHIYE